MPCFWLIDVDFAFSLSLKVLTNKIFCVQEMGSSEEALAWIPQDNFTILVNYILDNDTDLVRLHPYDYMLCYLFKQDPYLVFENFVRRGTGMRAIEVSSPLQGDERDGKLAYAEWAGGQCRN